MFGGSVGGRFWIRKCREFGGFGLVGGGELGVSAAFGW